MKTEIRSHSPGSGSWVSHYSVCHSFTCKSVQHAHVDVNYCTVLEIVPCWICFPKANRSKLFLEKQLVRFMYCTYPVTDHHQLICSLMHNSNSHITTHYECSMTENSQGSTVKKKKKTKTTTFKVILVFWQTKVIFVFLQTKDYWDNN